MCPTLFHPCTSPHPTTENQMENIGNFLSACERYGCNKQDIFQTVDLYEAENMPQVSYRPKQDDISDLGIEWRLTISYFKYTRHIVVGRHE